jgi:hypothetical protein
MNDHSELFQLFNRYWWLLFPLFWGIGQLLKNWMRHSRAKEALQVLRSYADQGKEPPAELVAVLRQPEQERRERSDHYGRYGWIPVFLFGALACAFGMLGIWHTELGVPQTPMFFVTIIMAGLCIGNLVAMQSRKPQDRIPPQ